MTGVSQGADIESKVNRTLLPAAAWNRTLQCRKVSELLSPVSSSGVRDANWPTSDASVVLHSEKK